MTNKTEEILKTELELKKLEINKIAQTSFLLKHNQRSNSELEEKLVELKRESFLKKKIEKEGNLSKTGILYFLHKNPQLMSLLLLDLNYQLFQHPFLSLKIRDQVYSEKEDFSGLKRTENSRISLYRGISLSFIGCVVNALFFSITHLAADPFLESIGISENNRISLSFIISEILSSPLRTIIESNRVKIQLGSRFNELSAFPKRYPSLWLSLLFRDILLRGALFTGYQKKHTNEPYRDRLKRYSIILIAGTIISTPLDFCFTRLSAQNYPKYDGIADVIRKTRLEESTGKLITGFSLRFSSIFTTSVLNGFFYVKLVDFFKCSFSTKNLIH